MATSMFDISYFGCGACSGMFGVLLSHPFDTIKTIKQNVRKDQNIQKIQYTPKFLYRGLLPPLIGVGIEKSIVFGVYHNFSLFLKKYIQPQYIPTISGFVAGVIISPIIGPIEHIKILLQSRNDNVNNKISIFSKHLFRGTGATLTREPLGFAIYFTVYENIKSIIEKKRNFGAIETFFTGGFTGGFSWILIYPQDRIKTNIQNDYTNKSTYIGVAKQIYTHEGFKGFYKGFQYALLRAIFLHAGAFSMMELLQRQ